MSSIRQKKILIIRMGAIGDVVHSTIIPQAIKDKYPDCEIHYLTRPTAAVILRNCPHIDKVIEYNESTFNTLKQLFKERYYGIIGLSYTLRSLILTCFSLPRKFAFRSYKGKSWVENYFNTAKKIFKDIEIPNRLYLKNDTSFEAEISEKMDKYPRPHIIFSPGGQTNRSRQGRIWNIKKWGELSEKLIKDYGGTIFVIGSKGEQKHHMPLERDNVVILSGKTTLNETCSILSLADLVISGDSGPAHIASAYNTKTLSILGSTSPDKIKPYGENGHYIEPKTDCKYCWGRKCKFLKEGEKYTPCIESILPIDVINKIQEENLL